MKLAHAQRALWRAVRYDPVPKDALSLFEDDGGLGAERRLAIYRNMYWYRQVDALSEMFPMLRNALGPERFTKLVCKYIRAYPSEHAALEYLGRAMPDFVAEQIPEHADLTRIEWHQGLALLAPDPHRLATVNEVDPSRFATATLLFLPSLHCLRVARRALEPLGEGLCDAAHDAAKADTVSVAVWRKRFRVRQIILDDAQARALAHARRGEPMDVVLDGFAEQEQGTERAFAMVQSWFSRGWIQEIQH